MKDVLRSDVRGKRTRVAQLDPVWILLENHPPRHLEVSVCEGVDQQLAQRNLRIPRELGMNEVSLDGNDRIVSSHQFAEATQCHGQAVITAFGLRVVGVAGHAKEAPLGVRHLGPDRLGMTHQQETRDEELVGGIQDPQSA